MDEDVRGYLHIRFLPAILFALERRSMSACTPSTPLLKFIVPLTQLYLSDLVLNKNTLSKKLFSNISVIKGLASTSLPTFSPLLLETHHPSLSIPVQDPLY
jgi:hypothetical protein